MDDSKFQTWLKKYLGDSGETNLAFAKRIGVHNSLIGHYLNGTRCPTYPTLCKIKKALRLRDMNALFD